MEQRVAQIQKGEENTYNRRLHTVSQIPKDNQQPEAIQRKSKQDSATSVAAHPAEQLPTQIL